MLTDKKSLIFLFLISLLTAYPLTVSAELTRDENYFYIRRYIPAGTTEKLLYNRSGPTIKTEYGLKNKFNLSQRIKMNLDFILQGSIMGLTDPPEQWLMNLSFERSFWEILNLKIGYDKQHNISRGDDGSPKGFGISRTYAETGLILSFNREKSYLYARQYILDWTMEGLFYDRSGPILRNEYGLKNKLNLPWQTEINLSFAMRGSSVKITSQPEQWLWNLELQKEIWEEIIFKTGYGKQYDISKSVLTPDERSQASRLYFEIGFGFN